jgi:mRNA interferase RelE/StbE
MTRWTIAVTPAARRQLTSIADNRIRQAIVRRIDRLEREPEKQGKALTDELIGYRSIRAVGQRYRIIYRLEECRVVVYVVAVGLRKEGSRKDVYAVAQELLRRGLLDQE